MQIDVIAVGQLRNDPCYDLWQNYAKRVNWKLQLHEIEVKKNTPEKVKLEQNKQILDKLDNQAYKFILDEKGKALPSRKFAQKIEEIQNQGHTKIQFVLGGADGLTNEVRQKSDFILSFGCQTWPHMLARVMLIEQIYRAQQINAGHPYHRD